MAKRNNFRRALKQLKSVEIEEKLNGLNEAPTNSMGGVYNLNAKGWHNDPPKPAKTFYPDADGNWPDGFPANAGDKSYTRPAGWWDDDGDWIDVELGNTKVDSIGTDGKSTDTIIDSDGYVLTPLPEGTRDFILGPLIDGFTYLHGYDAYTSIGYIQKDTRDFVLLAKIDGQWENNMNGSHPVWDGTENGLTIYNQKFTLEMAQWVKNEAYSESNSTREDDVEKRNLNHQLSPNYDITEKVSCCSRMCSLIMCKAPRDDIRSKKFRRNVRRSINFLNITTRKKAILLDRYVSLVEAYQKTRKRYTYAYNSTRSVVTLLNILTPAFVSIQPVFGADTYYNFMYWTTFATTVVSGLISSYIGLFKLYFSSHSTLRFANNLKFIYFSKNPN